MMVKEEQRKGIKNKKQNFLNKYINIEPTSRVLNDPLHAFVDNKPQTRTR